MVGRNNGTREQRNRRNTEAINVKCGYSTSCEKCPDAAWVDRGHERLPASAGHFFYSGGNSAVLVISGLPNKATGYNCRGAAVTHGGSRYHWGPMYFTSNNGNSFKYHAMKVVGTTAAKTVASDCSNIQKFEAGVQTGAAKLQYQGQMSTGWTGAPITGAKGYFTAQGNNHKLFIDDISVDTPGYKAPTSHGGSQYYWGSHYATSGNGNVFYHYAIKYTTERTTTAAKCISCPDLSYKNSATSCAVKKVSSGCSTNQKFEAGSNGEKTRDDTKCTTCPDLSYKNTATSCAVKRVSSGCSTSQKFEAGSNGEKTRDDTKCTTCPAGAYKDTPTSCAVKTTASTRGATPPTDAVTTRPPPTPSVPRTPSPTPPPTPPRTIPPTTQTLPAPTTPPLATSPPTTALGTMATSGGTNTTADGSPATPVRGATAATARTGSAAPRVSLAPEPAAATTAATVVASRPTAGRSVKRTGNGTNATARPKNNVLPNITAVRTANATTAPRAGAGAGDDPATKATTSDNDASDGGTIAAVVIVVLLLVCCIVFAGLLLRKRQLEDSGRDVPTELGGNTTVALSSNPLYEQSAGTTPTAALVPNPVHGQLTRPSSVVGSVTSARTINNELYSAANTDDGRKGDNVGRAINNELYSAANTGDDGDADDNEGYLCVVPTRAGALLYVPHLSCCPAALLPCCPACVRMARAWSAPRSWLTRHAACTPHVHPREIL